MVKNIDTNDKFGGKVAFLGVWKGLIKLSWKKLQNKNMQEDNH